MNKLAANYINELLAHYSPQDIMNIFVFRLDDKAFYQIGALVLTDAEKRACEPHEIVWAGYEATKHFDMRAR